MVAKLTERTSSRVWSPAAYGTFAAARQRPAEDLLAAAVRARQATGGRTRRIVDLGCGAGNMGRALLGAGGEGAQLECVDSSPEMLGAAALALADVGADADAAVRFTRADFGAWAAARTASSTAPDLLFSNAALHWANYAAHVSLLPALMARLAPGGSLAVQMPDTRTQASHVLMRSAAARIGLGDRVAGVRGVSCEADPKDYYALLAPLCRPHGLELWHTDYAMVLHGDNPVADFTASTGLGPYVDALGGSDSSDGQAFIKAYRELISDAYPKMPDGSTLFQFRRFFFVATKN